MTEVIRGYLREIGRGAHGARGLSRGQACELGELLFSHQVPPGQLGAVLVALRMKGETVHELLGLADALQSRVTPLVCPAGAGLPVVLPSYNGARRQPNLLPLLALLLRALGVPVLIHGLPQVPGRVTTAEILRALGEPVVETVDDAARQLATNGLVFVSLRALSPPLHDLLGWREVLGVRNVGHTLAKLITPLDRPALTLIALTHPAYFGLAREFCRERGLEALLFRGHEGEAVAAARRLPDMEWLHDGGAQTLPGLQAEVTDLPGLDAQETATYLRALRRGDARLPATLQQQAAHVLLATGRAGSIAEAASQVTAVLAQTGGW